jgi:hypothetical protein
MQGFLFKENRFVAVKKINVFEKVNQQASLPCHGRESTPETTHVSTL